MSDTIIIDEMQDKINIKRSIEHNEKINQKCGDMKNKLIGDKK